MTPKQKNQDLQAILCMAFLLIERLDRLEVTAPEMIKYRDDLIAMSEVITGVGADTDVMQKSTYFSQISKQMDTIMRKNFQNL